MADALDLRKEKKIERGNDDQAAADAEQAGEDPGQGADQGEKCPRRNVFRHPRRLPRLSSGAGIGTPRSELHPMCLTP